MFKDLTYKKKYQLLLAGLVLVAILIYMLAIKKTIVAITDTIELSHKLEQAVNAPEQIENIERQLKQIEKLVISDTKSQQIDFEQQLLERVTGFCQRNRLTLIEFPKTNITQYQDYQVFTNQIVIQGAFKQQLLFIYEAEQQYKIGKVVSVNFKRIKDIRTQQQHLNAYIYFQNIKVTKDE